MVEMTREGPLRALHIVYSHYPSDPRPRREAEALQEAGWEVTALSLGHPGEPTRSVVNGVNVVFMPFKRYRGNSAASYLKAYLRFVAWAAGQVTARRDEFDLVHVHTPPDIIAYATLPARWKGAHAFLDIHDLTPELYEERFGKRHRFIVRGARLLERWSAGRVDHVITVNEQVRRRLIGRGIPPEKISVTMNLPEERIFWRHEIPAPPERPVLAYHGTLVPHFGPGVLLEAAAKMVPRYPDLTVRLLGDGDMKAELEERAQEPDLAGRVEISPHRVPVHEIPEALGAVSAGAVANRAVGFPTLVLPTKLLEYLALGIPAVVTRTETIDHYFEPGEVVTIDRPDPGLLADALARILDDPKAATDQVRRARRFFERHSWRRERQDYVRLAEEYARRARARSRNGR